MLLIQDLKAMNMPVSVITILCQSIKTSRQRLDEHHRNDRANNAISGSSSSGSSGSGSSSGGGGMLINTHVPVPYRRVYARLERFRWRVDVTIANGSLAKVCHQND